MSIHYLVFLKKKRIKREKNEKGTGYFLNLIVVIASEAWQSLFCLKEIGPGCFSLI